MAGDLNQEFESLKADVANLRRDLSELAGDVREAGIERGRAAYERARAAERKVEQHPMASLLTSFGVGVLAGLILERRH